jgi:pimeloyl-ACP methyl ester carboxylesterase
MAAQSCNATQNGAILPETGTGNPEIDDAARRAASLGDRPLLVLTGGKVGPPPPDPVIAKQAADFQNVWVNQLQADLARLSTHGRQIVVTNSGHGIQFEAPEAVIKAVREVVDEVRGEASAPQRAHLARTRQR